MVFYFTATGNSLYTARQLDCECCSIPQEIHGEMRYSADKTGIVCPVYGHEMPQLVKGFIAKASLETDYLYLILTYGSRHGGAAELAEEFALSVGKRFDYINVLLMHDNFLPAFDMTEQAKLEKHIPQQLERIRSDISVRKNFVSEVTDEDRAEHRQYLERMKKMPADAFKKLYRITEKCIGCGICTKVCPMGCFSLDEQRAKRSCISCISCMACVHACPEAAIQLNIHEPNPNARYRNENVSLMDIINANWQKTGGNNHGICNT